MCVSACVGGTGEREGLYVRDSIGPWVYRTCERQEASVCVCVCGGGLFYLQAVCVSTGAEQVLQSDA